MPSAELGGKEPQLRRTVSRLSATPVDLCRSGFLWALLGSIFLSLIFLSAPLNALRNRQKDTGQKDEANDLEAVTIPIPFCGPTCMADNRLSKPFTQIENPSCQNTNSFFLALLASLTPSFLDLCNGEHRSETFEKWGTVIARDCSHRGDLNETAFSQIDALSADEKSETAALIDESF